MQVLQDSPRRQPHHGALLEAPRRAHTATRHTAGRHNKTIVTDRTSAKSGAKAARIGALKPVIGKTNSPPTANSSRPTDQRVRRVRAAHQAAAATAKTRQQLYPGRERRQVAQVPARVAGGTKRADKPAFAVAKLEVSRQQPGLRRWCSRRQQLRQAYAGQQTPAGSATPWPSCGPIHRCWRYCLATTAPDRLRVTNHWSGSANGAA